VASEISVFKPQATFVSSLSVKADMPGGSFVSMRSPLQRPRGLPVAALVCGFATPTFTGLSITLLLWRNLPPIQRLHCASSIGAAVY
jgi:hypothetical protein